MWSKIFCVTLKLFWCRITWIFLSETWRKKLPTRNEKELLLKTWFLYARCCYLNFNSSYSHIDSVSIRVWTGKMLPDCQQLQQQQQNRQKSERILNNYKDVNGCGPVRKKNQNYRPFEYCRHSLFINALFKRSYNWSPLVYFECVLMKEKINCTNFTSAMKICSTSFKNC